MSIWVTHESRMTAKGGTKRDAALQRERRFIRKRLVDSGSYHNVVIDDKDREVAIINSDLLHQKKIIAMPWEDLPLGGYVDFAGSKWLITERDANDEVYKVCKMLECNHLLKWMSKDGEIHEQWCVVEDGTKLRTLSFRVAKVAC